MNISPIFSFRHKAHIGWNHFYGFNLDTSGEPMDPTVSEIFQQIRKAIGTEATTEGEAKGMHSPTTEQPQKKVPFVNPIISIFSILFGIPSGTWDYLLSSLNQKWKNPSK
jgi:hypothetical protein